MKNNLKEALKEIEYFLLDMDGTIYLGDQPIGDMANTLNLLREKGKKIIFLTNNSSKNTCNYIKKLKKLNFYSESDEVYTSALASVEYISEFYNGKTVHVLGTNSVKEELKSKGLNVTESLNADIALLTYDVELTYEKLCNFVKCINNGARYFATHPDVCCPNPEVFLPDVGSFIKMIEVSNGFVPEIIIGKPEYIMGKNLTRRLNLTPEKFIMVGDRLHTDILFGVNSGFYSMLVLSGETSKEVLKNSQIKPNFILDSLNDVKNYF
ncbi:MAG: HAD-IIA family hydrolase [Clostridia bacterium]|nr:HAD-IIA family hydrolase [Clostridia bacterium]